MAETAIKQALAADDTERNKEKFEIVRTQLESNGQFEMLQNTLFKAISFWLADAQSLSGRIGILTKGGDDVWNKNFSSSSFIKGKSMAWCSGDYDRDTNHIQVLYMLDGFYSEQK